MKISKLAPEHRARLFETLDLHVSFENGPTSRGEVRHLSDDQVQASFSEDRVLELGMGFQVELLFRAIQRELSVKVPALVSERRDGCVVRHYRFTLQGAQDKFSEFILRTLRTMSRSIRVKPREAIPVSLAIVGEADAIAASLEDISAGGLAVSIKKEQDAALVGATRVRAQLQLPDGERLDLPCMIRHRALNGSLVRCGLQIDERSDDDLKAQKQKLQKFLLHCVREQT